MANKKSRKKITRNRSSRIWMETLEQRQLLAPIFGSAEAAGLTQYSTPPFGGDHSLSNPPVGLSVPNSIDNREKKTPLESELPSDRLVIKIV